MEKKKKEHRIKWYLIIEALLLIGLLVCLFIQYNSDKNEKTPSAVSPSGTNVLEEAVHEDPDAFKPDWTKEDFEERYAVNNEYICQFRFESGIIDLPVCDADDNSKYLFLNFETQEYDMLGTLFLEQKATIDSMNITIYGHYCYPEIDPDQVLMFTPLHLLKDEENYEANKYIDILTEDEARRYQVVTVYYCPLNFSADTQAYDWVDESLRYYLPEFDEVFFENYKHRLKDMEFYDTGVDFTNEDHLLTLQTCVPGRDDLRLIVVAKETESIPLK